MIHAHEALIGVIAEAASRSGTTVGVAESLTAGRIASALGAGEDASQWFRGGVVAYAPQVKFGVLGVTPGPVVTERCAQQMARGVADLLDADVAVATTGVGGPGPDEGRDAGTVFIAVWSGGEATCREFHFSGDPDEVLESTTTAALAWLASTLHASCG